MISAKCSILLLLFLPRSLFITDINCTRAGKCENTVLLLLSFRFVWLCMCVCVCLCDALWCLNGTANKKRREVSGIVFAVLVAFGPEGKD